MKGYYKFQYKNGEYRYYRYYKSALNAFFNEYGYVTPYEALDKMLNEKIIKVTYRELLNKQ